MDLLLGWDLPRASQKLCQGVLDQGGEGPAMTGGELFGLFEQGVIEVDRRFHT